jgi:hypothetical protein
MYEEEQHPSKMPGYSFAYDGKDGLASRNRLMENPGPGQYNPELHRKQNAKTFNSGPDDKMKELKDNGIPGPGTYPAEDEEELPKDATRDNAAPKWSFGKGKPVDKRNRDGKSVPGAGTYDPYDPKLDFTPKKTGVVFGTQHKSGKGAANEDDDNKITKRLIDARRRRLEQKKIDLGVPGPGEYKLPGDFDFPDPLNPEKGGTKKAKFCFGMNTKTRAKNLDMPGPGEYEVDQYPMN